MMTAPYKMILGAMGSILILGCAAQKAEAKQEGSASEKGETKEERNLLLSYPDTEDLEKQKKGETPSAEELKEQINEDNVMNPFPG